MTLSCINEYTKVCPTMEEYTFRAPDVELFLKELIEEFPENCLVMRLKENLEEKLADETVFDQKL